MTSPGLDAALAANDAAQIAEALLALIYTPALGDPEGPALLGGDIAQRHNFGLEGAAGMRRDFLAWALPREQVGDGSPWHVEGSLLGLDIALARLALRRIADNEMPVAPTINLNDQLTLARTVLALNPTSSATPIAIGSSRRSRAAASAWPRPAPACPPCWRSPRSGAAGLRAADAAVDGHAHARAVPALFGLARLAVARQAGRCLATGSTTGASTPRASTAA